MNRKKTDSLLKIRLAVCVLVPALLSTGFVWPFNRKTPATPKIEVRDGTPVLTLEQVFRMAMKQREEIRIASTVRAKEGLLPWKALSAVMPTVEGEASTTTPKEEIAFGGSSVVADPLRQASITVTQPLFNGSTMPGFLGARDLSSAGEADRRHTVRTVLFNVAESYFGVLRGQQLLEVAQESLRLAEEQLTLLSARYEDGLAPRNDLLRAQVTVSRAERIYVERQNQLRYAYSVLASGIGVSSDEILGSRVEEPEENAPVTLEEDAELAKFTAIAEDHRSDLKAAKENVAAQKWMLRQKFTAYLPSLDFEFRQSWIDPENFSQLNNFWTAMLKLNFPIFEGGRRTLELMEKRYDVKAEQLRYERLRKDVALQVEEAWLNCRTAKSNLASVLKEQELSQENYDIILDRYESGQATSLDVTSAFAELVTSRNQSVTQKYDYQLALLHLLRQAGLFGETYVNSKVTQEVF